jgi:hypothetical protein
MQKTSGIIKIEKIGRQYGFALVTRSGIPYYRSAAPHAAMFGREGLFSTKKAALIAGRETAMQNRDIVEAASEMVEMDSIKAALVSKYRSFYEFCRNLYAEIVADEGNKAYNDLHTTVPVLDKMLEDAAGPDKQIEQLVREIEESTSEDAVDEESPEPGDLDPDSMTNMASADLLSLRDMMRDLQKLLKKHFPEFIKVETASSRGLRAYGSSEDLADLAAALLSHYAETASEVAGMGRPMFEDLCCCEDGVVLTFRGRGAGRACVVMGDDMTFRGVYPLGNVAPHTYRHYADMLKPAMAEIGHWRPSGQDFVVLAATPGARSGKDCDEFDALTLPKTGSECRKSIARVSFRGGVKTGNRSFSVGLVPIVAASYEQQMKQVLEENARDIANASLVKIKTPGKYEGIAGTVDSSRIVLRNDHLEFPVMIEFDTGLKTEVWMTDDDVEIYLRRT